MTDAQLGFLRAGAESGRDRSGSLMTEGGSGVAAAEDHPPISGLTATAPTMQPAHASRPKSGREFRSYMIGYCAMSIGMGLNGVLNQYLIVVRLHESADLFGLAQTAIMLPMLGLIMFGGAVADRAELRAHLIRLQLLWAYTRSLWWLRLRSRRDGAST